MIPFSVEDILSDSNRINVRYIEKYKVYLQRVPYRLDAIRDLKGFDRFARYPTVYSLSTLKRDFSPIWILL